MKGGTTKHRSEGPEESQVVRLIHPKAEPVPMPGDMGAGEIVRRAGRSASSAGQPSNRDIFNADNRDIFRAD